MSLIFVFIILSPKYWKQATRTNICGGFFIYKNNYNSEGLRTSPSSALD